MIISLPWKDRKMMSSVAHIVYEMIAHQDLGVDRAQTFWRIYLYSKMGLLKKQDVRDILTAMESFSEVVKIQPQKDPNGDFKDIDGVISRLKAMMERKGLKSNEELRASGEVS